MNTGICKNCEIEFTYLPCQRNGIFCSKECQGEFTNKEKVLSGNGSFRSAKRYVLKHWEYKCSECNLKKWRGKEITLQLDHINGNVNDNRLKNLRWLCPNCHTQTETWGIKNISDAGKERLKTNKKERVV